jgi:hypothetical protein
MAVRLRSVLYKSDGRHRKTIAKGGKLKDLCHRHPDKIGFTSDSVHTEGFVYLVTNHRHPTYDSTGGLDGSYGRPITEAEAAADLQNILRSFPDEQGRLRVTAVGVCPVPFEPRKFR